MGEKIISSLRESNNTLTHPVCVVPEALPLAPISVMPPLVVAPLLLLPPPPAPHPPDLLRLPVDLLPALVVAGRFLLLLALSGGGRGRVGGVVVLLCESIIVKKNTGVMVTKVGMGLFRIPISKRFL